MILNRFLKFFGFGKLLFMWMIGLTLALSHISKFIKFLER